MGASPLVRKPRHGVTWDCRRLNQAGFVTWFKNYALRHALLARLPGALATDFRISQRCERATSLNSIARQCDIL